MRCVQCTVLRDMARLDDAGQPKSRCAGFVEFTEHEHALACLRQLNNNPSVVSALRRPIVEFAVENVRIVKSRERTARLQSERAHRRALAEGARHSTYLIISKIVGWCS
jgi:nucleolar protein 4